MFVDLKAFYRSIRAAIGRRRVSVTRLRGNEIVSATPLSVAFAGNPAERAYFAEILFAGNVEQEHVARIWRRKTPALMARRCASDNCFIQQLDRSPATLLPRSFYIPAWIGSECIVGEALIRAEKSTNVKSDLVRIRKNRLGYEIHHDLAALQRFYDQMYVPHITGVYGDSAFVTAFGELAQQLSKGALLLIKNAEGIEIAGGLLVMETSQRARGVAIGVRDGNREYIKQGAMAAIYYFDLVYLHALGVERLHYGSARPFLQDGAFAYKRKWGIELTGGSPHGFLLSVRTPSTAMEQWLCNNPFIHLVNNKLVAAVFASDALRLSTAEQQVLLARFIMPGLHAVTLYDAATMQVVAAQPVPAPREN